MKIALVHELLTMRGGAERVLKILADMYPDAPIYTLLYDEKKLGAWFPKERVRTPKLPTHYSLLTKNLRFNHHLYLRHFPKMIESFDFSEFDVVLSTSSAFAHGIITNGNPKHLSYINSPARYLWDRTHNVLEDAGKGFLGPIRKKYLEKTFHNLRTWDAEVAARPDHLLAASKEVQSRIQRYWRRESDVVYPPVDDFWLQTHNSQLTTHNYYLIVSTLVPYKRIELAIEACKQANVPLKIVGDGPDRKRLEKVAGHGSLVTFHGYTEREELRSLYANAEALLFPGIEDFGIAPLEAMACGTPVISYRAGGPLETVIDRVTGCFFDEPTAESLASVIKSFDRNTYDSDACRARAREFSQERFVDGIKKAISEL